MDVGQHPRQEQAGEIKLLRIFFCTILNPMRGVDLPLVPRTTRKDPVTYPGYRAFG